MIHQLLTTEYLFWLVAIFFYIFDNLKLVNNTQILITETITGKFKPSFSFNSFEIKGQQVHLLNLALPFTGFIKLATKPNNDPSINFKKTLEVVTSFQKLLYPFKLFSVISFLYLFSGPVLTFYYGLGHALILLLPIHLSNLVLTFIFLLISRKELGLSYGSLTSVIFDCLVVPAYLPNIIRKIYNKKSFDCDGYYFALKNCSEGDIEEMKFNISKQIDQTIEQIDESQLKNYYSYKKVLGISNVK